MSTATETVLNAYKATFILNLRGSDQQVADVVGVLKETLTSLGATVGEVKELGQIDFARVTDRKSPSAPYVQIDFEGASDVHALLNEKLRLNRTIYRIFVEARSA